MRDVIASFGSQLDQGSTLTDAVTIPFTRIIACGMGGSWVAGAILSHIRDDIILHQDYDLPVSANPSDLVVCISWSGETQEVLSAYARARALSIPVVVVTTGGTLRAHAIRDGVPVVQLPNPNNIAPRLGAGLMIGALFALLYPRRSLPAIDTGALEALGKELAYTIGDRMPVFYAASSWYTVATFFKNMVNENAKRHSIASDFPRAGHNEIAGWAGAYVTTLAPVFIRTADERSEHRRDLDAGVAILSRLGYTVHTIEVPGSSILEKALSGYVLALWTSFYMAEHLGIDPEDIHLIDEFKQLKKQ